MKRTTLYDKHINLGARMVEFGGYEMPVQYTNINEEHMAVRNAAGLFDVSHMGEFIVKGADAEKYLNFLCSNDVSKLSIGKAQYTCLLTPDGGIVDDLIIYKLREKDGVGTEDEYMLVVNAGNMEKDWEWINKHKRGDVVLENISEETALFALQGPRARDILAKITDEDLSAIKFYHFSTGTVAGIENILISGTGYTGSGGYELYMSNDNADVIWEALMKAGKEYEMLPVGLGARDTLRLEMGFCLYGHEIDEETTPLDAGLGWITKLEKEEFMGKDKLVAQKKAGIKKRLIGFIMDGRRVPRQGYAIVDEDGREVGMVTSGTQSPVLNKPIGMAYVDKDALSEVLFVQIRKKSFQLEQAKLPFIKIK